MPLFGQYLLDLLFYECFMQGQFIVLDGDQIYAIRPIFNRDAYNDHQNILVVELKPPNNHKQQYPDVPEPFL
jgi:hypothetical protein